MGWTWTHKPSGTAATDYLLHHTGTLSWSDDCPGTYRVLATSIVRLRTFYAAVERVDKKTGETEVWATVFLLRYAPKAQYNFGWKDMDETMGPCEAECPERILDLLTPTTNAYASDWRARCRAYHAKRRARPPLKTGADLVYQGTSYTVVQTLGNRGFMVRREGDGAVLRMNRHQAQCAAVVNRSAAVPAAGTAPAQVQVALFGA